MITYHIGDATEPVGDDLFIIPHVCNDIGAWGAGFVMSLSRKWARPMLMYTGCSSYELGTIQVCPVLGGENRNRQGFVVNMIAQRGIKKDRNGNPPIRYVALIKCLTSMFHWASAQLQDYPYSIHMPRIGCGLAGGHWAEVEFCIEDALNNGIRLGGMLPHSINVYDLPK